FLREWLMIRRLLNFATVLSLVLSASALVMWARSHFVTERWEFTPKLHANAYAGKGNYTHRLVDSGEGRLVYVDYDAVNAISRFSYSHTNGGWQTIETMLPLPIPGYHRSAAPLTPELRGMTYAVPIAYLNN